MPTCSAGHHSDSGDFCDTCGTRLGAAGALLTATADPPGQPCQRCGTVRSGRFCETCGFDSVGGTNGEGLAAHGPQTASSGSIGDGYDTGDDPRSGNGTAANLAPPGAWTAVVGADPVYYESVMLAADENTAAVQFPGYCTERRFPLGGTEIRIGRRSVSRGLEPEIDLGGPPVDPGISRLHAVLLPLQDGGWAILDPGSENGTLVNHTEIAVGVPVPLIDGDCIHLGAWTKIVIQAS